MLTFCRHVYKKSVANSLVLIPAVVISHGVFAQSNAENVLSAKLSSELGYTDNFLHLAENEQSTSFITIKPSVLISTQLQRSFLQLSVDSSHNQYHSFSKDNHTNVNVKTDLQHRFTDDKGIYLQGHFDHLYELRGTALTRGEAESISAPDDKQLFSGVLGYTYGQIDAVANVDFSIGYSNNRYQSRREVTRLLDRENYNVTADFDYLISGRSYLAISSKIERYNNKHNEQLDQDQYTLLVGFNWKATQITQISTLFGYQRVDFDKATFEDEGKFKWRIMVDWQPTEFTTININSTREFEQANTLDDSYRVVESYQSELKTKITDNFSISADIGYESNDVIYQAKEESENYLRSNLSLEYQRNERVMFHLGYSFYNVDADNDNVDSQRHSISMGINVTI